MLMLIWKYCASRTVMLTQRASKAQNETGG